MLYILGQKKEAGKFGRGDGADWIDPVVGFSKIPDEAPA